MAVSMDRRPPAFQNLCIEIDRPVNRKRAFPRTMRAEEESLPFFKKRKTGHEYEDSCVNSNNSWAEFLAASRDTLLIYLVRSILNDLRDRDSLDQKWERVALQYVRGQGHCSRPDNLLELVTDLQNRYLEISQNYEQEAIDFFYEQGRIQALGAGVF